jgi:hypothetical protein
LGVGGWALNLSLPLPKKNLEKKTENFFRIEPVWISMPNPQPPTHNFSRDREAPYHICSQETRLGFEGSMPNHAQPMPNLSLNNDGRGSPFDTESITSIAVDSFQVVIVKPITEVAVVKCHYVKCNEILKIAFYEFIKGTRFFSKDNKKIAPSPFFNSGTNNLVNIQAAFIHFF